MAVDRLHDNALGRTITEIARWCVHHAIITIVLFFTVAGMGLALAVAELRVDTDPALMIDTKLPFRKDHFEFIDQFPALDNAFLIVVDAAEPELARQTAGEIAGALRQRTDLFSNVFAPGTGAYYETYGVLYLDEPAVKKLADDIKQMMPLIDTMSLQPDLSGLDDLFRQIVPVAEVGQAPAELSSFFDQVGESVEAETRNRSSPLDWTSIGGQKAVQLETRWYVLAKPVFDFSELDAAARPIGEVRRLMKEINGKSPDVTVQLTGEAALNAEEFEAVTKGAAVAGALSFTLVTLTVLIGMPSLVLLVPALALIVLGFFITAGFATLSIGYLNMISVAFAVLFIGLGIDYAVHVILRFAEERAKGQEGKAAAVEAVRTTGTPLALCTLTTTLAFLAFTPTDFTGMAQLGIIAAGGILIAFIASITLVPAILSMLPGPQETIARRFRELASVHGGAHGQSGSVVRKLATLVLLALAVAAAFVVSDARFDSDPINLKDPEAPSMVAFKDVAERQPDRVFSIEALSRPGKALDELVAKLKALPEVAAVETLATRMPRNQQAKLADLHSIADLMPPGIDPPAALNAEQKLAHLSSIQGAVTRIAEAPEASDDLRMAAGRLRQQLSAFIAAKGQTAEAVTALQSSLVSGFPILFEQVRQLSTLDAVTLNNVDRALKDRYVAPDGRWRIEIIPQGDMRNEADRDRVVEAVTAVHPRATGSPVEIKLAADVVVSAIRLACITALVLVGVVTFVFLRRVRDVLLVLAPLVLAAVLMLGYTVVFSSPFNFANVIVLPLLLGLGIDSAIHYVMRARQEVTALGVTRTSTPRAVLISAVTTMGSFGTLWLSAHRGMASMGELLTIAIIITLVCTLVVLPQLIAWTRAES